jgi:hypothetical protein
MDLTDTLGQDVSRQVRIKLSDNEDAKKSGETTEHSVKFVILGTWTINDLIDRLMISSSPKVAFQAAFRGKDTVPESWNVNKAGFKAEVDVTSAVMKLSVEKQMELLKKLQAQFGDMLS